MMIRNTRTQYAVGQGFFHTGELSHTEEPWLRYVVDCGAMTSYAQQRDARIDAYLKLVGAPQPLDILFISHAHADHLNGVERLLNQGNGLAVQVIVLPLLSVEDRLIAYARTALVDSDSANSEFYKSFVVNPAQALRRFGPRRIIFVRPGDPEHGSPFSRGPEESGDGPGDSAGLLYGDMPWNLVGTGSINSTLPGEPDGSVVMPDSLGMVCTSDATPPAWLLAPYVDPSVEAETRPFLENLAARQNKTLEELENSLRDAKYVLELLTTHLSDLQDAYIKICPDLNITSMCLYSGPVPTAQHQSQYLGKFGASTFSESEKAGVAWLGTGDAALRNGRRRRAFLNHYRTLLQEVVTMTLPHHGSECNFHTELLDQIQASFCVASADRYSNWRHPGSLVVQAVASAGRCLSVVTSNVKSEVNETSVVH